MPLAPIESVGLVAAGASSAASTISAGSAKFAGLMRGKLRSMQRGAIGSAQGVATQLHLPNGNSVDLGQLRTAVNANLKQIQSQLTADAARSGIDVSAGVTLQVDSNGVTHVAGSTQQQAALESLIAADSQLDSLISSTAQKARLLHAAKSANGSGTSAQQSFEQALSGLSGPLASVTLVVSPQRNSVSVSQGE